MTFLGLSKQEVEDKIQQGDVNTLPKPEIRSNFQIIRSNLFTLFNLYNLIIASALIYVQAYTSLFFVGVIVSNTVMFTYQEIRSRNLVAKLNIIVSPKTTVIRDGKKQKIDNESIVLGDYVLFTAGEQISADAELVDGYVEMNESLLTGEIDPIDKHVGDQVLSGSFVVSGTCIAVVTNVGKDNYAAKITSQIKTHRSIHSELLRVFKKVTKITTVFIIPLGGLLMYQGLVVRQDSLRTVVVNTASALLGMLPQGLVLLTTVTLVAAVLKLGARKILVQDLYAIELLSQADVLCIDKTGTLTMGAMKVIHVHEMDPQAQNYMSAYLHHSEDSNATALAMKAYFSHESSEKVASIIPFSSARKWSGVTLENGTSIITGAPEIVAPHVPIPHATEALRTQGARIILLATTQQPLTKDSQFDQIQPAAFIAIEDPIREDAQQALNFFKENDVEVKVISGDNVETVEAIAKKAGIDCEGAVIDCRQLTTDEAMEQAIVHGRVFGRATPNQKLKFVEMLQKHGKRVAMTGDGINDVLALKKADISIAMGEGSDAALNISQVVIMDGNLETLVDVVKEGRQVINNITQSASMYYLRTILSIFLSITAVIMNVPFPFIPFQITLSNMFIDGFPSFMILFEKNIEKPKEAILDHVLRHSVPNAFAIIMVWIGINILAPTLQLKTIEVQTILFFVYGLLSIHMIYRIYKPLNLYRGTVLVIDVIGYLLGTYLFWPLLELSIPRIVDVKLIVISLIIGIIFVALGNAIVNRILTYRQQKRTQTI